MGAPARLAAFAALLAVVGAVAALAGAARGDGVPTSVGHGAPDSSGTHNAGTSGAAHANGLATEANGYTFAPVTAMFPLGRAAAFQFRVLDARGEPIRHFDLDGGVRMHLIVVRRDFASYHHVHPEIQPDGSWSAPLELSAPGVYRAFVDFEVAGRKTVLGHDVFVGGEFTPQGLPTPSTTEATDGYFVTLAHGDLRAGEESELRFQVSRGEQPEPLEPYLGYRGHMVALRDGDLSYSHVHPQQNGERGEILFHAELPSDGKYRLFLQFKAAGVVHTAPFTVEVER
jgi:hypothetical protein